MNSRQILQEVGLSQKDLVDLLIYTLPDLSLVELDYILMNVESEFDFREQAGLLDEGNEDE